VLPDDTPASLAERVLVHEHRVYPMAIASRLSETN
jgi:folate-dependent phosphoribosylglycinamide formyltransferase PurN